jgi:putative endonuclease
MSYFVYILKSKKHKRYYVGSAEDIKRRVETHNSERARWTKRFQPWSLVYSEEFELRGEAMKREKYLKSLKGIANFLRAL